LQVLPTWEILLDKLPEDAPKIATSKVKWDVDYQKKHDVRIGRTKGLSAEMERRIGALSRRICRCLGTDGCVRIDFRLDDSGHLYFLEANPDVGEGEEFAGAAEAAGMSYPALLQKIVNLGIRRAERG
jgi:D-alanine-D-alanine ligase